MNKNDLRQLGDLIDQRLDVKLDEKLGEKLKPIQETLDSHSETLVALENETMPMIKEIYENTSGLSQRIGGLEKRQDDLEPRVGALEATVSK